MYLLDTNHCSRLMDGDLALAQRVADVGEAAVVTCVIVQGELLDMAHRSERVPENLAKVQDFLADIGIYGVDEAVATIYGTLKATFFTRFGPREKSKRRSFPFSQLGVSENDLWIAATALRFGLTVVSADSDFARLQQVQPFAVENWLI